MSETQEAGFELAGEFYRWRCSDSGKDLMLIDRFTQMPIFEFFETIEDSFDRGRGPVLLALIATSIRAARPEWSVERIVRLVLETNLGEVEFVGGEEEDEERPPVEVLPPAADARSSSAANGSSPSSTPAAPWGSKTSSATPP
jgi:hypothetical protein